MKVKNPSNWAMGVNLAIVNVLNVYFGGTFRKFPVEMAQPIMIGGVSIGRIDLLAGLFSFGVLGLLWLFLYRTKWGLAIRCSAIDILTASLMGINVKDKALDEIVGDLLRRFEKDGKPFLWVLDDVPAKVLVDELRRWYAPHNLGKTLITDQKPRIRWDRQGGACQPARPCGSARASDQEAAPAR